MPELTIKSALLQVLMGVHYLHENWILHLDLKPDNLLVQTRRGPNGQTIGVVKITDFGLARIFKEPTQPLCNVESVVVTLWYRSPELLLNAKHFTPAIDVWAVGCIFAEMIGAKVLFKGLELKPEKKQPQQASSRGRPKPRPHTFQSDQCYQCVFSVFAYVSVPRSCVLSVCLVREKERSVCVCVIWLCILRMAVGRLSL